MAICLRIRVVPTNWKLHIILPFEKNPPIWKLICVHALKHVWYTVRLSPVISRCILRLIIPTETWQQEYNSGSGWLSCGRTLSQVRVTTYVYNKRETNYHTQPDPRQKKDITIGCVFGAWYQLSIDDWWYHAIPLHYLSPPTRQFSAICFWHQN